MEFVEEVDVGRSRSVMCGRSVEFVCIEVVVIESPRHELTVELGRQCVNWLLIRGGDTHDNASRAFECKAARWFGWKHAPYGKSPDHPTSRAPLASHAACHCLTSSA